MNIKIISNSNMVKNGIWLYILQFFNTVIPLLTLPYISRVLGSYSYGEFSFALNIITYFQVIVEYGFGLSGSRKVAIESDKSKIEKIFSRIIYCRFILCLISFIVFIIFVNFMNITNGQKICMIILFFTAFATIFQQTWLFQGMECMKYITLVNVISRTSMLIATFIFVNKATDIYLYCIIYSLSQIFNSILSLILVKKTFKFRLKSANINEIIEELKDGWYTFTTSIMGKIFTGIGVTFLGVYGTSDQVGIYSAIQKIPIILGVMFNPISQILYPYISKQHKNLKNEAREKLIKTIVISVGIFSSISIIIILLRKFIVNIMFGSEYVLYSNLLVPLCIWMVLGILNNFLGIQILVASGKLKEYSRAFNIGVISIIVFNFLFIKIWNINGAAYATLISEIILTIALIVQINRSNVLKIIKE